MVEPAGDVGVHWLEPMFVEEEQPPFDGRFPKSEPSSSASSCQISANMELWTRRVRGVGATSDMRMTHADMANHHRMRKPWGFQEVSRKTWQIMDLGHGRMANCVHGQLWVPSVQEGDYPSPPSPTPACCSLLTHRIRHVEPSRERSWNAVRTVRGGVTTY